MNVISKTNEILEYHRFDSELKEFISTHDEEHKDRLLYYFNAGGKRIRPALAYASYFLAGGKQGQEVTNYAIAVELTHSWSLAIDDIQDRAKQRRGVTTHHRKFSKPIAELDAFKIENILNFALDQYEKKIRSYARNQTSRMINGQELDLRAEQTRKHEFFQENRLSEVDLKSYRELIGKKTSSLIKTACKGGGLIAKAREGEVSYLENYGKNLGLSYQCKDDRLDFLGKEGKLGKEIGKDISQGKLSNIVVALAADDLDKRERNRYRKVLEKEDKSEEDRREGMKLTLKTNALDRSKSIMQDFGEKALESLERFPESEYKQYMQELVEFNLERKN